MRQMEKPKYGPRPVTAIIDYTGNPQGRWDPPIETEYFWVTHEEAHGGSSVVKAVLKQHDPVVDGAALEARFCGPPPDLHQSEENYITSRKSISG